MTHRTKIWRVNSFFYITFLSITLTLQGCGKADIESNCSSNGFGQINCNFHNKGNAEGTICIKVKLLPTDQNFSKSIYPNGITSQEICSGIVKAEDVVERTQHGSFEMTPSVFCSVAGNDSWSSGCLLVIENQTDKEPISEPINSSASVSSSITNLEPSTPKSSSAEIDKIWSKDELIIHGKEVYESNCSVCHQSDGKGLPPTFPPLAGSKIVNAPIFDKDGKLLKDSHLDRVLNGKNVMPPWKNLLNEVDIAAVVTYERNSFGNNMDDIVQPAKVKTLR